MFAPLRVRVPVSPLYLTACYQRYAIAPLWQEEKLDIMSAGGYIPSHLSEADLRKLLLEALNDAPDWKSPETFHARFDHLERGISIDDVIFGIERAWTFERAPEFSQEAWQWKYYLATETIEGDTLTILVAVDTGNRTFDVVTRWSP